jgi:Asp-tRNA(Asn)/Glu-tRNA(Gln) amidotransferase C subunit
VGITDDLERVAHLAGLSVSSEEMERLAPALETLYADLDRLRALPIADLEPAFTPRLDLAVP